MTSNPLIMKLHTINCYFQFLLSEINAIAIDFIFILFISIGCICDICDGNKARTAALFELGAKLALTAPI